MTAFLRRVGAFFVRDFRTETSYRLAFLMQLAGVAWTLGLFWFLGRLIGPGLPQLERYGGSWFAYVALGYAPLEYLRVGVLSFSARIREAQAHGTLEALLVTPIGIPTIVFGSVAWAYAWTTGRALAFLAIGALALGELGDADPWATLVFMALSLVTYGAIGVLSASFVMVFKKADPVSWVFLGTSTLFAGLFFPTEILGWLERVSWFLPLTWSMEGVRRAVLGEGLGDLWPEAAILALFAVVLIPTAAFAFRHAVDRARRDGTLSHY